MNNGRRRSSGEGGATVRRIKGEEDAKEDKKILVQDKGIRIECDICLDNCHHATSTQCCQAQACRHCALSYVLRNRTCWNCGEDKTGKFGLTYNKNIRNEIQRRNLKDENASIQCELCKGVAKKGVRTKCCGERACRSCARRFVVVNRTCWSLSCPGVDRRRVDTILEPDPLLQRAVAEYNIQMMKKPVYEASNKYSGAYSNDSSVVNGNSTKDEDVIAKEIKDDGVNNGSSLENIDDTSEKGDNMVEDSMELESDTELEMQHRNHNSELMEEIEEAQNEYESEKTEIVVSDDSDSDIQEIPQEDENNLTEDDISEPIDAYDSNKEESVGDNTNSATDDDFGESVKSNDELSNKDDSNDDDLITTDDVDKENCKRSSDQDREITPSSKKRKFSGESEYSCTTLGDIYLSLNTDNYVLLRVSTSPSSSSSAFTSEHKNISVNVELTKELKSLVWPLRFSQEVFNNRILSYKQYSFILLNLRLGSNSNADNHSKSEDANMNTAHNVLVPGHTCVATCRVDSSEAEDPVCLNMTACVDFSVTDVFLKPNSSSSSYTAVKTYLKFQKNENISKRSVLELPFIVGCCLICDIQIQNRIYRANPCKYLAPQNVASNDILLDMNIRSKSGKEIYMCKNMMVCEVTSCENNESIPKLLDMFGYKLEDGLEDSSNDGVFTNNKTKAEDDKEKDDISEASKDSGVDKENSDPSRRSDSNKQPSIESLDEESRKALYEKKMKEGHEFFSKACYMSANKRYSEALTIETSSAIAYSWRSNCHYHLNNIPMALEDAEKSVELDPSLPESCLSAIKASIAEARIDKAKEYVAALNAIIPDSDEKEGLEQQAKEAEAKISNLEALEAEIAGCIEAKEYATGLDTVKDCLHHCRFSNRYRILKAELLAYVGGFEESNRIINELKGFSQNPDCLYVKALGQYYKDSLDLSSHFLKDVLSMKPEHSKALELQSKISEHKKADEKVQTALKDETLEFGLEACDEALKVDVDNKNLMSRMYYLKGKVYSKHDKQLEAIDEYSTAVRLNSLNSKAFFSRAKSFMSLELYDEALKDAEVVIRHESGNSSFRQLYSQVKGKYDEYKSADFYKLLGVEKTSSQEEIRKAYRKAALVHHPDRHSSKHEKIKCYHECRFKDIGEAYGVLSDEAKRLLYDKGLLNKSIPTPSPTQAPHFTNISNVAMQNAAFWASVVQQQRQGMGSGTAGLAGARPGAGGAGLAGAGFAGGRAGASTAGLAGASPFFFVPGGATGASAANFMQHMYTRNPSAAQYRFPQSNFSQNPSAQFRFSQSNFSQNPYRKY